MNFGLKIPTDWAVNVRQEEKILYVKSENPKVSIDQLSEYNNFKLVSKQRAKQATSIKELNYHLICQHGFKQASDHYEIENMMTSGRKKKTITILKYGRQSKQLGF